LIICPYCGSSDIVFGGLIVCQMCGSVIDVSYSYDEEMAMRTSPRALKPRRGPRQRPGRIFRIYRSILGKPKLRPGVTLSKDALKALENGMSMRIKKFSHTVDEKLSSLVRDPHINKILEIIDQHPRLSSRTTRVRVMIAFILMNMAMGTRLEDVMIDPECFGTSRTHIGRVKIMLKNHPAIEELIEDIKKILDNTDHNMTQKLILQP
jgi:hypothetical protein